MDSVFSGWLCTQIRESGDRNMGWDVAMARSLQREDLTLWEDESIHGAYVHSASARLHYEI
jgi:hypothetical protein